eukprot:561619-Pelagomonas_calceolata.AAC.1
MHQGKQVIGAGVYRPASDCPNCVQPNGAGIANTIVRAELAAIAAASLKDYSHIANDSLSSLYQIRKQMLYPELHRQHVQGHILKILITLLRKSPSLSYFYKVKSYAGIAGNKCADASPSTIQDNDVTSQGRSLLTQPSRMQALKAILSMTPPGLPLRKLSAPMQVILDAQAHLP